MKLEVIRFSSEKDSTSGLLFDVTGNRKFLCYTLEDQYQTKTTGIQVPLSVFANES